MNTQHYSDAAPISQAIILRCRAQNDAWSNHVNQSWDYNIDGSDPFRQVLEQADTVQKLVVAARGWTTPFLDWALDEWFEQRDIERLFTQAELDDLDDGADLTAIVNEREDGERRDFYELRTADMLDEIAAADTFEKLQQIGRARGYQPHWAGHQWDDRMARAAIDNIQEGAATASAIAPTHAEAQMILIEREPSTVTADRALNTKPPSTSIQIVAGELHIAATAAEDAIIASSLPVYQRGETLVRPISHSVSASRGRTTIAAGIGEIGVHAMIDTLSGCATFERYDGRSEDYVRINPPMGVVQVLLSRHGQWRLPSLAGVITTPTLRPDGSILSEHGYDPATRLYHVNDPSLHVHPAVYNPTRVAAERALRALKGLLSEFPFTSEVSRSVALSGLITPVARGALSVAPLHLYRANTAGSGKSYLADITSAISSGRPCPVISAAPDEAETEKRLAGLLLAGYPLISIDNVNGEIGGDLLCQAIERPLIRLRRLGASEITEIESVATVLATGNNARVRGDMVRRTIIADLDAQQERPELRQFTGDPVATVMADRGRFVSACLVIVRAYIQAGKPNQPAPLASFADWSTLVRGALMWLGCADPVISMESAREDDPELTDLREMLSVWSASVGADCMTTREVASAIEARETSQMGEPTDYLHPDLREMLHRLFGGRGTLNTKLLGRWLSANEGRIVGGRRFKRASIGGQNGVVRWRVETV